MPPRLIKPSAHSAEYFGATFEVDDRNGYALSVIRDFQSPARAKESFSFVLEAYMEQERRNLILDLRGTSWPMDIKELERRFGAQAKMLPKSRIGAICDDPNDPILILAAAAYRAEGHTVLLSSDEAEVLNFVAPRRQEDQHVDKLVINGQQNPVYKGLRKP